MGIFTHRILPNEGIGDSGTANPLKSKCLSYLLAHAGKDCDEEAVSYMGV